LTQIEQAVRMRVWQRPEKDAVHDAEDRAVRADAECQGEHRDESERGGLSQLRDGEAYVRSQRVQSISPFHGSLALLAKSVKRIGDRVHVAEATDCFGARCRGCHAGG